MQYASDSSVAKVSQGPFPWPEPGSIGPASALQGNCSDRSWSEGSSPGSRTPRRGPALDHISSDTLENQEIMTLLREIDEHADIHWRLPGRVSTAGAILNHAYRSVNTLLNQHKPMSFKVGFTHKAVWRWESSLYGYKRDKAAKWKAMEVLYISEEPCGPAMLEAALIEKYGGALALTRLSSTVSPNLAEHVEAHVRHSWLPKCT